MVSPLWRNVLDCIGKLLKRDLPDHQDCVSLGTKLWCHNKVDLQ